MNKYYVIVPAVLLAGFLLFYRSAVHEMDLKDAAIAKQIADDKAAAEAHQRDIDRIAQEDALKHQRERDAKETADREKKEHDYQAAMTQLKNEADNYSAEADKLSKEAADLEIALIQARALRDKTSSDAFDVSKQVEMAKINRRIAEMEIQRVAEMVGAKASGSYLTALPPPPPPPLK